MRLRTLFLTPLILAAPVAAPQPAAAQYWTDWKQIEGPFSYRIVAVTREIVNGYPRTAVIWEVRNTGREVGITVGPRPAVVHQREVGVAALRILRNEQLRIGDEAQVRRAQRWPQQRSAVRHASGRMMRGIDLDDVVGFDLRVEPDRAAVPHDQIDFRVRHAERLDHVLGR